MAGGEREGAALPDKLPLTEQTRSDPWGWSLAASFLHLPTPPMPCLPLLWPWSLLPHLSPATCLASPLHLQAGTYQFQVTLWLLLGGGCLLGLGGDGWGWSQGGSSRGLGLGMMLQGLALALLCLLLKGQGHGLGGHLLGLTGEGWCAR